MKGLEVISVNVSDKKGIIKKPAQLIDIDKSGVKGDAHAGEWNRQVSLLSRESIEQFSEKAGRTISNGEFAENITTRGMKLSNARPLDKFISGRLILEVTQIGKKCHGSSCSIFREVGQCVMPSEGIFCRVLHPGMLRPGDMLEYSPKTYHIDVITISDRTFSGIYEDKSGPAAVHILEAFFKDQHLKARITARVIPDEPVRIEENILNAVDDAADIIVSTGGTGVGPKDFTPEVIRKLIDKDISGIMNYIRMKYGAENPKALLSRSIAGIRENTQIYALPGSVNAVKEYLEEITKTLLHTTYMLHGLDLH
jgi:molybdopterin adenylyltransferase